MCKAHQKAIGKLIDIGDDTADDLARAMRVNIRKRELLDTNEGLMADVFDDAVGHAVVQHADDPLEECRKSYGNGNFEKDFGNARKIYVSDTDSKINGLSYENGNVKRKCDRRGGEKEGERKVDAIDFQISQDV